MSINANLNAAGSFAVPGGYPVRLLASGESMLSAVVPPTATGVSATVQTESGTANAHLALYMMPTTSGGADNALVLQTDATGVTTTAQTLTITVPSGSPVCYVVRLWVDTITGANADTISRDGTTAVANEPKIPVAVKVTTMSAS